LTNHSASKKKLYIVHQQYYVEYLFIVNIMKQSTWIFKTTNNYKGLTNNIQTFKYSHKTYTMHKHRLRKSISVIKHPVVSCLLEVFKHPKIGSKTNKSHPRLKSGYGQLDHTRRLNGPVSKRRFMLIKCYLKYSYGGYLLLDNFSRFKVTGRTYRGLCRRLHK